MGAWFELVSERWSELWLRIGEHLVLTGVSTGIAILLGLPLGIVAARAPSLRGLVTGVVGILQTIPSLAMLVILLALIGKIGATPAIIALTLYALLPIVRNTLAGLLGVPPESVEAARGIGMTARQRLLLVELPLALPVIVAGIRTAAVVGVGIATLSAFIGAGGLGQFINRGLALSNTDLILLGAVPAALLALVVDGSIATCQWGLDRKRSTGFRILRPAAIALPVLLLAGGTIAHSVASPAAPSGSAVRTVRIGTKNFTEQLILGELMALLIEARTDLRVERRFNLGGTMICHGALESGGIDLYAEYTGTGLTAILKQDVVADPMRAYEIVRSEYRRLYSAVWLKPFGFNNTYAITIRKRDGAAKNLRSISDLAAVANQLRAGFTAEFSERPDGYPGLRKTYGLDFAEVRDLDPGLMYKAIANGEIDVICAFATDGRIAAYELQPLRDDRGFFPPYRAAPVVRAELLASHPGVREVLDKLAGRIDDATMQRLNFEVDEKKQRPRDVARRFLQERGLVPASK